MAVLLEADIDLNQLGENIKNLKKAVNTDFCAVVKADAYGHGIKNISKEAAKYADELAVATLDEAIAVSSLNLHKPINILGGTDKAFFDKRRKKEFAADIIPSVCGADEVKYLPPSLKTVNIKVNTGMNRIGVKPEELRKTIAALYENGIKVKSIFTHFYKGESEPDAKKQLREFQRIVLPYKDSGIKFHAGASFCIGMPDIYHMDMVRFGLSMYGYSSITKPIMSVHTNILQAFDVKKGEHISYGDYVAPDNMRVAAIRTGYGDGYRRKNLLPRFVSVNGVLCPVAGQVCMDITVIDVSKVKLNGDERVYLLGGGIDGKNLSKSYNTIIYEVLTSFTGRIKRNYIKNTK